MKPPPSGANKEGLGSGLGWNPVRISCLCLGAWVCGLWSLGFLTQSCSPATGPALPQGSRLAPGNVNYTLLGGDAS